MSRFANVEYITYDEIKKKREEEQKRWNSYEWKDLIVDFYDSVNLTNYAIFSIRGLTNTAPAHATM